MSEYVVLAMEKNTPVLDQSSEKTGSEAKLADIPLELRRKEARKPLL
jgi:hypothetical protein